MTVYCICLETFTRVLTIDENVGGRNKRQFLEQLLQNEVQEGKVVMSETDQEWRKTGRVMHARRRKNSTQKWIIGGLCDYRLFDLRGRLILMEFYSP